MVYDTAGNLLNDAALELGIISEVIADPYGSDDPNIIQLLAFLKSCGRRLTRAHPWRFLQKEYTLTTVTGTDTYALPTDFRAMVPQTGWVRTTQLPLGGPLDAQSWQFLKSQMVGLVFVLVFRPRDGFIQFSSGTSTPGSQLVAFEYKSDSWVLPTGSSSTVPTANTATSKDDTIWFDPQLFTRALKLYWLREKGMDTAAAEDDYDEALASSKEDDVAAPLLHLDGGSGSRLLGEDNVPDTGLGS